MLRTTESSLPVCVVPVSRTSTSRRAYGWTKKLHRMHHQPVGPVARGRIGESARAAGRSSARGDVAVAVLRMQKTTHNKHKRNTRT